jgi:hypothetical protein
VGTYNGVCDAKRLESVLVPTPERGNKITEN